MNPNRGLRIHARATCRGKRRRKCAKKGREQRVRRKPREEQTNRRDSCRVKGKKSLQPVSERSVPGQSIKNVSRAEIIKVRIYIYKQSEGECGARERGRGTMRGPGRAVFERKREKERVYVWVWEKKGLGGCLKYSPTHARLARDGKSLLIRRPRRVYRSGSIWFLRFLALCCISSPRAYRYTRNAVAHTTAGVRVSYVWLLFVGGERRRVVFTRDESLSLVTLISNRIL